VRDNQQASEDAASPRVATIFDAGVEIQGVYMEFEISIYHWKGNKDVLLTKATVHQVPRVEELVEFTIPGQRIQGKVTRVLHDFDNKVVNVRIKPGAMHVTI
jgi:hypothetical protein